MAAGSHKRHPALVFALVLLIVAVVFFGIGYFVGRLLM